MGKLELYFIKCFTSNQSVVILVVPISSVVVVSLRLNFPRSSCVKSVKGLIRIPCHRRGIFSVIPKCLLIIMLNLVNNRDPCVYKPKRKVFIELTSYTNIHVFLCTPLCYIS